MALGAAEGLTPSADRIRRAGFAYALTAIGIWGFIPLLYKELSGVPPFEVIAYRVLWGLVAALAAAAWQDRGAMLLTALQSRRQLATMAVTATLIAINWLAFIFAVNRGLVLQSSLGYFIGPLVNVLLGVVFLRERLSVRQVVAIALAAVGVLNHTVAVGELPWIALTLGGSFALYAYVRKVARAPALEGLTIELLWLAPIALGYLWFAGSGGFSVDTPWLSGALIVAGVSTALPLVWYTEGSKRMTLATIGILQFIAPSMQFLLAVFAFGEPFRRYDAVTFVCIWVALAVYLWPVRKGAGG